MKLYNHLLFAPEKEDQAMIKRKKVKSEFFNADQDGINQLKNRCFSEAEEFCYFRKGEWTGIESSILHALEWAQANPEWVAISIAAYTPSKDFLKGIVKATGVTINRIKKYFGKPAKMKITRRVICGKLTRKSKIREWESICGEGSVVTIPKIQTGNFRYILNEKEYAIFSRFGANDLRGVIGSDKQTIIMLREMFDREFIEADLIAKNSNTKKA